MSPSVIRERSSLLSAVFPLPQVPGEITAVIGGTGSGKSTLISLIPRFYDIDSGSILVDDTDIQTMAQKELRSKIGFVPQTAILFSGTVSDNIRYGKDDASEDEIRHAADVAQASEFITAMKDGFDSMIAQGGTNVSGGQKQRLSIAARWSGSRKFIYLTTASLLSTSKPTPDFAQP